MNSNRRSGLLAAGIVVLIIGLLAAGGLWYSAGQRQADAVRNLARAPIGCDTTLDFEAAGEFLVFVETRGEIGETAGSCAAPGEFGQLGAPQDLPPVRLMLTDSDGSDVALDARTGIDYDTNGFSGQVIRQFVVDTPGDHVLRVEATNDAEPAQFAIAIGRDPSDGVQPVRLGAIAAAIAGLVGGLALIVLSRRNNTSDAVAPTDPWLGQPAWPTSPPGVAQQAPPVAAWQQQPGPPIQAPFTPTQPTSPSQPVIPGQPGMPGQPVLPGQPPMSAPGVPTQPATPTPSPWAAETAAPAPQQGSGASGDGERSPWAPPGGASQ